MCDRNGSRFPSYLCMTLAFAVCFLRQAANEPFFPGTRVPLLPTSSKATRMFVQTSEPTFLGSRSNDHETGAGRQGCHQVRNVWSKHNVPGAYFERGSARGRGRGGGACGEPSHSSQASKVFRACTFIKKLWFPLSPSLCPKTSLGLSHSMQSCFQPPPSQPASGSPTSFHHRCRTRLLAPFNKPLPNAFTCCLGASSWTQESCVPTC
jgi:hypothetical protein